MSNYGLLFRVQVMVVVGPFNEHMIREDCRAKYAQLREGIIAWLARNQVPHLAPEALTSELYADASPPLTDGYAAQAGQLLADAAFSAFAGGGAHTAKK